MKLEQNKIVLNGDYMRINSTPVRVNLVDGGMAICYRLNGKPNSKENKLIEIPVSMLEDITFNEEVFDVVGDAICNEDGEVSLNNNVIAHFYLVNKTVSLENEEIGEYGAVFPIETIYKTDNVRCLQRFLQCHRQNYEFDFSNCEIK